MIFLLLSILSSTAIYAIFKTFKQLEINSFQAIVANYFVASIFGFSLAFTNHHYEETNIETWIPYAAGVGVIFISLFYLMSKSSQENGVSITGLATKMSMLIPVGYFIIFDQDEGLTVYKVSGIILGILSLLLATSSNGEENNWKKSLRLPLIIFIGSGILDLILAYVEKIYLIGEGDHEWFTPIPFAIAGLIGILVLAAQGVIQGKKIQIKSLLAGLVLGLVNYGSIYFLLKVLGSGLMDRSTTIPLNNMGVVAASAIVGILIFKEKMTKINLLGIALAIVSIAILTWS